jgi:hypothetical protein
VQGKKGARCKLKNKFFEYFSLPFTPTLILPPRRGRKCNGLIFLSRGGNKRRSNTFLKGRKQEKIQYFPQGEETREDPILSSRGRKQKKRMSTGQFSIES